MSPKTSPPFVRRQLGRTLRRLREQAKVTVAEACKVLEFSKSKISRIELGDTCPDIHLLKSMLDLYQIPVNDWEPVIDLFREAKLRGWWQSYGLEAMNYVAIETAASTVREFSLAHIPGLLQTEDYVRAAMAVSLLNRSRRTFENEVQVRLIRQHRLTDDREPLELAAIIDETALLRPVGGEQVRREQLAHLVMLAELPTVTIQVVPTSIGVHVGMISAFTLLSFDEPTEADVGYVEHVAGSLRIEKPEEVRACRLTFERLRTEALNPAESVALIDRLAGAD